MNVSLRRSGTATYSSDYTTSIALTNTVSQVTIPAGAGFLDLTVTPVNDTSSEGPEYLELTVWQDSAYAVLGQGLARIDLEDNEVYTKPSVNVSTSGTADNRATESGDDYAYFRIYRTGNVSSNITVYYAISGTATSGLDYQPMPGSVILAADQTEALLPVIAVDDLLVENDETVTLTLVDNAAYTRGTTSGQSITILDDDPPLVTLGLDLEQLVESRVREDVQKMAADARQPKLAGLLEQPLLGLEEDTQARARDVFEPASIQRHGSLDLVEERLSGGGLGGV